MAETHGGDGEKIRFDGRCSLVLLLAQFPTEQQGIPRETEGTPSFQT